MFDNKKILITGGTGSLGQALTKKLLSLNVDTIRIFSRNEHKQIDMESKFNDKRLRFLLGDIRDLDRLTRAVEDIDIVFHAAALKHVPKIEYNPFESIKTNVVGSQNVIDACFHQNVERAVCIGTDKGVSPFNTYGATKLLMEKLFVTANHLMNKEKHRTKFIAVRYGNVLGSAGSVVPKFIEQIQNKEKITITDPNMTRFNITMDAALKFILESTELGQGSEVFVPKLKAYSIMDLKDILVELLGEIEHEIIGIRTGEKLHELLISEYEIRNCWKYKDKFILFGNHDTKKEEEFIKKYDLKKLELVENYSSENAEKLSKTELKQNIIESGLINNLST